MMSVIQVQAEREYSVVFTNNYIDELVQFVGAAEALIIVPESLQRFADNLPNNWSRIGVIDGESQKNSMNYIDLLEKISALAPSRNLKIIAIGGGATTDLAGFVAATYLRGVDWIAVPTSLAGMVDAAIGGKTGINLNSGKNLAGAFHSPTRVIIDLYFLQSLPERDVKAGLAEVIKCGFIADPNILNLIQLGWRENLPELIHRAVSVKAHVVSSDFKESFLREILNYGHTLGHAIEKHSQYKLRHGECVSIGMVYAAELSHKLAGLSLEVVGMHRNLLTSLELPISYHYDAWPQLLSLMRNDKKKNLQGLRFVTLSEIAVPERTTVPDENILAEIYLSSIGE